VSDTQNSVRDKVKIYQLSSDFKFTFIILQTYKVALGNGSALSGPLSSLLLAMWAIRSENGFFQNFFSLSSGSLFARSFETRVESERIVTLSYCEGSISPFGKPLKTFKCEMIEVGLGKLRGCLTPNTCMITFRIVIGNGLAHQMVQVLEGLCFSKQFTSFCLLA